MRELLRATGRRKAMEEGKLCRQIEEKQADSKLFWRRSKKVIGGMKGGVSPPPMAMDAEERVETDPIKVLEVWRKFSEGLASEMPEEEGIYDDEYKEEVEKRLRMLRDMKLVQDDLDDEITEKEVFVAIRKLKMGKAPGVDGILTSILKTAADAVGTNKLKHGNTVVEALTLLFNYVFSSGEWPERWGSGIIFPLYKEGSRLKPGNFRPITLLSCVGKLFGSIVETRLSKWSEATGTITDHQGGFRQGRGAPDQIFLLREILSSRKERGLATLASYVDCRKAYDTVWRDGNAVRLFDAGVQGKMWRQIQAMSAGLRSKVRLPHGETEWFRVLRGVAQGAPESPWLYSNFINGLSEELELHGLGVLVGDVRIPLLMYADDVVMLASSIYELRQMNEVATQYAFKYRFRYNGKKSAVMAFNANKALRRRVEEERWVLSGEKVEVRSRYKYLGVDTLTNAANWNTHVERVIATARSKSRDLLWMCKQDQGLRPRSASTMWKALVRPILEYSAELWAGEISKKICRAVEKVQTDFARAVLGLTGEWGVPNILVRA